LIFENLRIDNPNGGIILPSFNATISKGERVLISGDPASSVHLFKVVAGLWPWGAGKIIIPDETRIFFMPRRPYLPVGTLGAAIAYPSSAEVYTGERTEQSVLKRVGLEHLIPRLTESATWEDILSQEEQQRLGFARLLLHSPDWIFIEEATDSLSPDAELQLLTMLMAEFPNATILTIGYHTGLDALHHRTIVPAERRLKLRTAYATGVKRGNR
jgi:putative ATP-binding cassette transporter